MVRRSFTAVLERNATFSGPFETEPYEAGWASEARLFVRVLEWRGEPATLEVKAQISPDGACWCDEGGAPLAIGGPGLYSLALANFGQWLRFAGNLRGGATIKVMIYLALKE